MKPKEQPKKSPNKKIIILVTIVLSIGLIGLLGYMWWQSATINYAQEAAKPIEEALVKAGAVKTSSGGDAGRGVDSREPWYDASFDIGKDKAGAVALIQEVAKGNGYALRQATSNDRGPLGAVADIYISNWYFDDSSKQANYAGLNAGSIRLAMAVNYKQADGDPTPQQTTIRLQVRLPSYK